MSLIRSRFKKDKVREIMRTLTPYDQAIVLGQLAPVRRNGTVETTRGLMKAPLVLPFLPDLSKVAEFCRDPRELGIVNVAVHELYEQPFRLCIGQHSASTVEACRVLNVPIQMTFDGWYQCRPDEYRLREGQEMRELYWGGAPKDRPFEFGSDAIANIMYMLGVERCK